MAYALEKRYSEDGCAGMTRDPLLDGLRKTTVYSHATPSERADLEAFLHELRFGAARPDRPRPGRG